MVLGVSTFSLYVLCVNDDIYFNRVCCDKEVVMCFICVVLLCSHLDISWDQMYNNEPTDGLSNQDNAKFILGGMLCLFLLWSLKLGINSILLYHTVR